MTPHGHFTSLMRRLGYASRSGSYDALVAVATSDDFLVSLCAVPPAERLRVMAIVTEAVSAPRARRRARRLPPPRRCIKWTELAKARFKKAWLSGGPEAAAIAMDITYEAAMLAGKRQGLVATPRRQLQIAA